MFPFYGTRLVEIYRNENDYIEVNDKPASFNIEYPGNYTFLDCLNKFKGLSTKEKLRILFLYEPNLVSWISQNLINAKNDSNPPSLILHKQRIEVVNISDQSINEINQAIASEKYLLDELRIVCLKNSSDTLAFSLNILNNAEYLFKALNIISRERSFRHLDFLNECTKDCLALPSWYELKNKKSIGTLIGAIIESLIIHNLHMPKGKNCPYFQEKLKLKIKDKYYKYVEDFLKEKIFKKDANGLINDQQILIQNLNFKFQQINIEQLLHQIFKDENKINENLKTISCLIKVLKLLSKHFDISRFIELIYFYPFALAQNRDHLRIFNIISKNIRSIIDPERNDSNLNFNNLNNFNNFNNFNNAKNIETEINDLHQRQENEAINLSYRKDNGNLNILTRQQIIYIKTSWIWTYIENIYQNQIENKESEIKDGSSDTSSAGNNKISNLSDDLDRSHENAELINISNDKSSSKKSKSNKHTKKIDIPMKIENKINRKSKKIQKEEQSNCLLNKKKALETLTKGIFDACSTPKKKKNNKKSLKKEKASPICNNSELSKDNIKSMLYDESNSSSSLNLDENIQQSKNEESNSINDDISKIEISKKEDDNSQDVAWPIYNTQRYYIPRNMITYVKKSKPTTPDPSSISSKEENIQEEKKEDEKPPKTLLIPTKSESSDTFLPYKTDNSIGKFFEKLSCEILTEANERANFTKRFTIFKDEIINVIKFHVTSCFPKANILLYGSHSTELAIEESDIDITIYGLEIADYFDLCNKMNQLVNSLYKSKLISYCLSLPNAKVPIINIDMNLFLVGESINMDWKNLGLNDPIMKVDLTFMNYSNETSIKISPILNALKWSKLLKYQMIKTQYLKEILIIVKKILSIFKMNIPFSGGLGSYALALMVIAFLNESQGKNVGEILWEFLDYYGNVFDVNTMGIGFGINYKICYVQLYEAPEETENQIIILDPLNPGSNITKSCFQYQDICRLFRSIVNHIRELMYSTANIPNYLNVIFESLKLANIQ